MPKPEPPKDVRHRSTTKEREYRTRKLMQLAKLGWDAMQMREFAQKEWNVSDKTARRLVDLCYDAIVNGMSQLDRRRIAAICLVRFENAYRLAASQRNPMAMIQANAHIANHWVRSAPEITINEPQSDELDPDEDF